MTQQNEKAANHLKKFIETVKGILQQKSLKICY